MPTNYLAICHPLLTVSGKPGMHGECTVHSSCGTMLSNPKGLYKIAARVHVPTFLYNI